MGKLRMIKPKFNRKMPQNAAYFFSAESDEAFKKAHPIGYGILVAVGIAALLFLWRCCAWQ